MYQQILEKKKIQLFGNTDIKHLFTQNTIESIQPFQIEKFKSFLCDNKKMNDELKYIFQRFRKFNYNIEKKDKAKIIQKISRQYQILKTIFAELQFLRFQQNNQKEQKIKKLYQLLQKFDTFNIQSHLIIIKNKMKHQNENIVFNKIEYIRSDIKNIARKYQKSQTNFFYNTLNMAQSRYNDKIQRKRRLYGQNSLQIARLQHDQSQKIINNWLRKQQCNQFKRNVTEIKQFQTQMKFNKLKGNYYTSKMIQNLCTKEKCQNDTVYKQYTFS